MRQTDVRQTSDSIIALCPHLLGVGHNNDFLVFNLSAGFWLGDFEIHSSCVLSCTKVSRLIWLKLYSVTEWLALIIGYSLA